VNEDAANETVQIIRQENSTAKAICADVTSHDDIRRMVEACINLYGRIDLVDYNERVSELSVPERVSPCGPGTDSATSGQMQ
jgi:NAD(P)-dependent dehydrogenase (short-subunit alcohol dehydrogenase family)